jgi:eukaryotic-like serine/threonine-protein kinase
LEPFTRTKALGKYKLITELGRGGMGIVYLAATQGPGGVSKLLVVKELHPELVAEEAFFQMFLDEARLTARLSHPNVVQTYEVGEEGGRYFMAMEYLEGQTLQRALSMLRRRSRPMPRKMHLRAVSDVLLGLHYAHELKGLDGAPLNVVHRDVSPHSIFLTYDGQIKLVDFGIAKALDARHETAIGTFKGKVTYMAPEQVTKSVPVDRRADVFAAGAVLWEALVGRKLWEGVPMHDVFMHLTRRELPPNPAFLVHGVPPELDRICARAMAIDPADRYETALAFRSALEQYIQGSGEAASAHDVGHFVGEEFAEERATRHSFVEAELARLAAGVGRETFSSGPAFNDRTPFATPSAATRSGGYLPPRLAEFATPTATRSGGHLLPRQADLLHSSLNFAAQQGSGGGRRLLWLGGLVAIASAGLTAGAVLLSRSRALEQARAARAVASAQQAAATSRPGVPAVVTGAPKADEPVLALNIRVNPVTARVSLDDEPLAPDALASVRPRDKKPHRLYAEAEGYFPRTEIVIFDATNLTVNLALDRRPPGSMPPRNRLAPPSSTPPAAPPPGEAANPPRNGQPPRPIND